MPKHRPNSGSDRETLLAEAALRLLEKREWREITLASVARSVRLPLSEVLPVIPSKGALPGVILRMLATETARRHKAQAGADDPRERLFEATMAFFDVQKLHATALKKLYRALQYDPPTLLVTRNDILRLAGKLLALAEADIASSPQLQCAIYAGIVIRAVSAWRDDDEEMGKTMAQVDGDLRRAERLLWPKARNGPKSQEPKRKRGGPRSRKRR